MRHFVIGTAGHVDHGKTVLVRALTGVETDRLKEEKERGISIELGFAPFKLPSGIMAGVVDVPGHERFIKNMLAGIGGIDLVLLVVAADEGIMPQTREHLEIIDLLQVQEGIIVITKADLVEEDWLELVREEVRELVGETVLEDAPVAEVSAITGKGIAELVQLIDNVAANLKERPATGQARMAVDRVFSMTGFGTVVTGTLIEGRLQTGETVDILPGKKEARVRGLQVHGRKVEVAEAGQRVAVNLAGIDCDEVERGSILSAPGSIRPSHRIDIRLRLLAGAPRPLVNRARVRVHIGTAEVLARVILLEADELEPGRDQFAQLECEQPVAAARGDRLVIRSYSPMRTIAGGKVIDPYPPKRKRLNPAVIETLKTKERGTPEELVVQFMASSRQTAFSGDEFTRGLGMDEAAVNQSIGVLTSRGLVIKFTCDGKTYYMLSSVYNDRGAELTAALDRYHRQFPLRDGLSKEEIRSRDFGGLNNKVFNAIIELYRKDGMVSLVGENVARQGFEPGPRPDRAEMFRSIEAKYLNEGFQTPGWDQIAAQCKLSQADSDEVLNYFINRGVLVKLEENVLMHRHSLNRARELVTDFLKEKGQMSLAEARDLLNSSRRYALPIMSYLDKEKVTRRIEDKRVLY